MSASVKIALVTGGSRGLGKDMCTSLANKGIDGVLTYRTNESAALKLVKEIEAMGRRAVALPLYMNDFNSLDNFVQSFSNILQANWQTTHFDYLINNAGMGATVPFLEVKESMFDEFLNVHFKGIFFLT